MLLLRTWVQFWPALQNSKLLFVEQDFQLQSMFVSAKLLPVLFPDVEKRFSDQPTSLQGLIAAAIFPKTGTL